MASTSQDCLDFRTPSKKRAASPLSSPSSISTNSTSTKQRSITENSNTNDETITTIKMEEGNDEVKVFSVSTIKKHEPDDDVDVDGIEDRLSPVVEEPSSPMKNEALNGGLSSLYTSPFLYPYFHPMFHPYLMAAAAQANAAAAATSTEKSTPEQSAPNPYGAASSPMSPFSGFNPGMPFSPLYPPGMVNQTFRPNLFNPFGIPIPTAPGVRPPAPQSAPSASSSSSSASNNRHHQSYDGSPRNLNALLDSHRPKKPHIKKPLNAFMLYMKEQRARVIEECTLKESSAINKVLGQKWKELPRAEQDRYYELAKEERNRHMQLYPGWSARDNYGMKKKRQPIGPGSVLNNSHKKVPRENNSMVNSPGHMNHNSPNRFGHGNHLMNSPHMNSSKNSMQLEDCLNQKKCRARFGLEGQSQWCKHCRRKKKCTRFLEDDFSSQANNHMMNQYHHVAMNKHGTGANSNGNPSSLGSPTTNRSDNEDSMNEPDGDDILSRQVDSIEDDDDDDDDDDENHNGVVDEDDDNDDDDDERHHHEGDSDEENKQQHHHHQQPISLVHKPSSNKLDSHHSVSSNPQHHQQQQQQSQLASMQQHLYQAPPAAHLYQPSLIPPHFAPGFHY